MKVKNIRVVFKSDKKNGTGHAVIIITGTPGTGKSSLIKLASSTGGCSVLNISDLVKKEALHDGHDADFDTLIINDRKVRKRLKVLIPQMRKTAPVLIECHSLGLFDCDGLDSLVDGVLVLTCSTENLYDRLQARGYSQKKMSENVECEIMRVCADEAVEVFRNEKVLIKEMVNDTEKDREEILETIKKLLNKQKPLKSY